MKAEKVYFVEWHSRFGTVRSTSGTLPVLYKYFGYTIEVGRSWNSKISRKEPKSIKALVNLVNACIDEQHRGYERPYICEMVSPNTAI